MVYQAAGEAETIPIEVELDLVRRQPATGLRGLGQTLESFRDRTCDFPVYSGGFDTRYPDSLGPLSMPTRGTQEGIGGAPPAEVSPLADQQGGTEALANKAIRGAISA